jgi:DNA-binding NtrC family response regulator
MVRYSWPGNVRQLENVTQRLVILSPNGGIVREQLPRELLAQLPPDEISGETQPQLIENDNLRPIERLERRAIFDALESCKLNVVGAAESLGMGQATLYRKIKRYGFELKKWRSGTAPQEFSTRACGRIG